MVKKKVIIMGAAGRDFHDFNTYFRDNEEYEVVAFTATQIPDIEGRKYPAELAGRLYPEGIPIYAEESLPQIIKEKGVDEVVFSYSDVSHEYVMHRASIALANGAGFRLIPPKVTMLKAAVPVIAVCAVRTGAGKSQTTRRVAKILQNLGKKVVVVRHPMPYGDLKEQAVQRFASYDDMDRYKCTIEEREEYEPHIDNGIVVYAGVDYEKILRQAEKECDVLLWDGGNNDLPFYKPDLHIVVADPHRPGHEAKYHPGEANLRMADVVIINKVDTASPENVEAVKTSIREMNPDADIIEAGSPISTDHPEMIRGKSVLVVEDGPTLTHGEMKYGAGTIAARRFGAREIVEPEQYAVGSIKKTFKKYPHLKNLLPAMGYGKTQIQELQETINKVPCDLVVSGTPINLERVMKVNKPILRVRYELDEIGRPNLEDMIKTYLRL
ncbi:MAG: cyclic 2,3-diphosphoglycerate synthase [Thermoplasmata archaeon]|nr:cyclic 2,3-diphosphoglycerate synthase [Thermoplasmata archaeon]